MKNVDRMLRVQELLRAEIAAVMLEHVNNAVVRNAVVTLSRVDCARDMARADVYFLCHGEPSEVEKALQSAAGFIRRELFSRLDIRKIPELRFKHDFALSEGAKMSAKLAKGIDN